MFLKTHNVSWGWILQQNIFYTSTPLPRVPQTVNNSQMLRTIINEDFQTQRRAKTSAARFGSANKKREFLHSRIDKHSPHPHFTSSIQDKNASLSQESVSSRKLLLTQRWINWLLLFRQHRCIERVDEKNVEKHALQASQQYTAVSWEKYEDVAVMHRWANLLPNSWTFLLMKL